MNWRLSVPICLLLLAGCGVAEEKANDNEVPAFPDAGAYVASPQQERVDRSFSDIPIETRFAKVEDRLTQILENDCEKWGECEWRDSQDVRYYFWGDGPDNLWVVVKHIDAAEFAGRAIPALGIGPARRRDQVLAAAEIFLSGAELECSGEGEEDGSEHCVATLGPGWVTVRFDATGTLTDIQLDGYHYT